MSSSLPLRDDGALRGSLMLALFTLFGLGLAYSLIATGITGALFSEQANGSLLRVDTRVVGSLLVAQPFTDAGYFQPRPSAARYDLTAASGSNQARSNPDLLSRIAATRAQVAAREGIAPAAVPGELLTQSGSGLDPHLSPAGAIVVVECEHMCMSMRGVQKPGAKTVTSAVRGQLRETATRAEAMSLILGK